MRVLSNGRSASQLQCKQLIQYRMKIFPLVSNSGYFPRGIGEGGLHVRSKQDYGVVQLSIWYKAWLIVGKQM